MAATPGSGVAAVAPTPGPDGRRTGVDAPDAPSTRAVASIPDASGGRSIASVPDPANALALAYRAGRTDLLPALSEALRTVLLPALNRYGTRARPLPASLERADLVQQSWLILDMLARRWDPAGGDFGAYVRTTFPWELWRYVQYQSPGRRARAVRVDNVQHQALVDQLGDRPGTDGRDWDEQLIAAELLDELDPLARRAFLLYCIEDRSLLEVSRTLRLTRASAYRAYRRALDRLRLRAGLEVDAIDAAPRSAHGPRERIGIQMAGGTGARSGGRRAIERLVEALHAGAAPEGRLPGRAPVCARAGLSEARFARLMGLLVERGCIMERSARRPGRLVHATPAETLAHLERARVEA